MLEEGLWKSCNGKSIHRAPGVASKKMTGEAPEVRSDKRNQN